MLDHHQKACFQSLPRENQVAWSVGFQPAILPRSAWISGARVLDGNERWIWIMIFDINFNLMNKFELVW